MTMSASTPTTMADQHNDGQQYRTEDRDQLHRFDDQATRA
jgi:hypothetical protein